MNAKVKFVMSSDDVSLLKELVSQDDPGFFLDQLGLILQEREECKFDEPFHEVEIQITVKKPRTIKSVQTGFIK